MKLLDEIVPHFKKLAAPYYIQIVFVYMSYGVRDENNIDHMTYLSCGTSCLDLSLQGNKYGYLSCPRYNPQKLFDEKFSTFEDQSLLKEGYQLDTNNEPSRYIIVKI